MFERSRHPKPHDEFVPRPHHDRLLAAIHRLHFMTVEQVTRLLYKPGTIADVRKLLNALETHHYLLSFHEPRSSPVGSTPKIYMLDHLGFHRLKEQGYRMPRRFREPDVATLEKNYLFLRHHLAVTDFLIAAAHLETSYPAIQLYDFLHERTLKQQPPLVVVVEKRTAEGQSILDQEGKTAQETIRLYPDAFLDIRIAQPDEQRNYRFCFFLELDRNTQSDEIIRKKIRGYLTAVKTGACLPRFGTKLPTIAFVNAVGGIKRRDELRRLAEDELKKTREPHFWTQLFVFTDIPSDGGIDSETLFLSPVWYMPFEDKPVVVLSAGSR